MPLRRRRAQYYQLATGEHGRIIELHELGLSLWPRATYVGHNVSTIQCCVPRWIQSESPRTLVGGHWMGHKQRTTLVQNVDDLRTAVDVTWNGYLKQSSMD
ncbi:hypothetical protein TNCV_3019091 [Trichonephila clavipes]|nr:hypothetical protein TNCV_3019091 [Trichonephila clavipes]